jgi:site-specific DNA-adenine methylase
MKLKQFIINYCGNKYRETEKIKNIDLSSYKYIIEPFGGSFGFSRYVYYNLGLTDKKFIICDINKDLIDFYIFIKDLVINNKIDEFMNEYNRHCDYMISEYPIDKSKKKNGCQHKKKCMVYINNIIDKNINFLFNLQINARFFSVRKKTKCDFEIFKKCEFINKTVQELKLDEYNDDYFFYLDPPYIDSCNKFYGNIGNLHDIYDLVHIIMNTKKCIFIHLNNWFVNFVYIDKKIMEYGKLYDINKKRVSHIVYGNCEFINC